MQTIVSIGELFDKHTILNLKLRQGKNDHVSREISELKHLKPYISKHIFYYNLLLYINESIWILTNRIKRCDFKKTVEYAQISHNIFDNNQKRFRIKNIINHICNSDIREQKFFSHSVCKVFVRDINVLVSKLPEINYLLVEYDSIIFETDDICTKYIQQLYCFPNIFFDMNMSYNSFYTLENLVIDNRDIFSYFTNNPDLNRPL